MYEPLANAGRWLMEHTPRSLQFWRVKFNFILVHYCYMIGMSLTGSVILYGSGLIPYVDALFFGTGASTQSGLNTIDVNDLKLYQQLTLFFIANVANPIFINTFVVFVRLYWFEKRFKHVVREIREQRRSRAKTMTRTRSEMKEEQDLNQLENGVGGRQIRVLHETTQPNGMSGKTARTKQEEETFKEKMGLEANEESVEASGSNTSSNEDDNLNKSRSQEDGEKDSEEDPPFSPSAEHHLGLNPKITRDVVFADEVKTSDQSDSTPEPASDSEQGDMSRHIQFLERQQRNAREGSTLHIPGPRAFDRGELPQQMNNEDENALHRPQTRNTLKPIKSEGSREGMNAGGEETNADDQPGRSGITWNTQEHPGRLKADPTLETAPSTNSKFGLDRIRSGVSNVVRHRRSNSNNLHLNHGRGSIGRTFTNLTTILSRDRDTADPMPYLSWQATTGRNSAFLGLTEEQREELGGIEYRSLKMLAKVLICYFIGFHVFGMVILLPWIKLKPKWRSVVIDDGVDPGWWGVFSSASLFNDLGLTLTPNSMLSFQRATVLLVLGSFLIIIGNTGFPVMLRFVIWVATKVTPYGSQSWEELRFLLDHPRRCFTLLFPSKATWWLFWILVILNGVDVIFFIILDLNDPTVISIPPGFRVLDAIFQAASTRTAGFSVVNLAELHPAIQVSYMVMMYISVFPIAISVRRTNVYEEKSLGLWGGEEEGSENDPSYVGQHLRRQLSFDLWFIFLGFFIICIVEGDRLSNTNDWAFTMFSVLFEIVSAYGTVGLSLGYPTINASFSAQFKPISKLVICAMMLRGRHRGLPYALDRAILLPSEHLQKKEAEEADRRAGRRPSIVADGPQADRLRHGATFNGSDLDAMQGLSKQQTAPLSSAHDMGGGETTDHAQTVRRTTSRMSGVSNTNNNTNANSRPSHQRSRSLSRVIAGGLSAGPTLPKNE